MAARLARRGALPCCAPAPGPRTQRAAALRSAGGRRRRCAAQAGARQLEIHVGDTTVAFPLQDSAARELSGALVALLQTFAAKQAAERPRRWPAMEYKLPGGDAQRELEHLEVFCNPNAYSTAFDAKVLVALRTAGGVRVTTEARLSALKSDVDAFVEQLAAA